MQISELDQRSQELLNKLLNSDSYIKIRDIAADKNISRRSVYYDLCKVNEFLEAHKIPETFLERNKGIYLDQQQKEAIQKIMKHTPTQMNYYFSPMERVKMIICLIALAPNSLYIEDFIQLCQVSRNTIINDLKVASALIQDYDLTLLFENKIGYVIQGDIIRKRAVFFLYFPDIADIYKKYTLPTYNKEEVEHNLFKLSYIEKTLDTKYVEETLMALAVFIPTLQKSDEEIVFRDVDNDSIMDSYEYKLVNKRFSSLKTSDKIYLALHLLGSRLQTLPFDIMNMNEDQEPYELAKALVGEFSRIACVEFDEVDEIERSLFVHLKSSLYRYRYGIQLGNPLIDDIKIQYPELFEITKKASEYITQKIGVPINDSEIAYLTLHFGAFITPNLNEEHMNILIVCPNGISTGNMLRGEVSALVPHANIIEVISLNEFESRKHEFNVVISTVAIQHTNSIIVHPILTDTDRISILKKCMHSVAHSVNVEDIFHVVKKYITEDKHVKVKEDLKRYLENMNDVRYHPLKDGSRGMSDYLSNQHIQFIEDEVDWRRAILMAGTPLIVEQVIEPRYIDAIVDQTRLLGPYMFITEDVMLAHAKAEDGVNEVGFSMAIFKKDVLFPKEKSAKIILVLAAVDQVKHLKILKDIMTIFSSKEHSAALFEQTSVSGIIEEIKKQTKEKV